MRWSHSEEIGLHFRVLVIARELSTFVQTMSVRILASTSRALASGSSGRVFASRAVQSTVQRRKDALFDPYPLPLSPGVVKQQPLSQDSEEWPIPPPLDRTGEDEATLRARLVYQSRKRGTLETDLILATFAREQLPKMSYDELMEFDKVCYSSIQG